MLTFLESLSSDFDKNMNTIDAFYENAKSQYLLELSNAETLVMTESYDENQLSYLYEQAEETFSAQVKTSIAALKETIVKFCTNIKNKINSSKDNNMSGYEQDIKTNPFMKKGEIKIDDTREEIKVCEKYSNKLRNLSLKAKSGRFDKSSVAELKSEYESERKKAVAAGVGVAISVPVGYALWKTHVEKADKNIQKISDDGIVVAESPYVEIAQLSTQIAKDHSSAIFKLIGSLQSNISKFANSVKGKQKTEKEVIKESVDEPVISDSEFIDTGFNEILSDIMEDVMNQRYEETVSELNTEEVFTEEAKFSIFPKFKTLRKQYPELDKAEKLIKEINSELEKSGEQPTSVRCQKVEKMVNEILVFNASLSTLALAPFCIFIVPILSYLISRLIVWEKANNTFDITEKQLLQMISKIKKIIDKNDDPKIKKKYEKILKELEKALDDLRSSDKPSKEKNVKESSEYDFSSVMELSDNEKLSFVNAYLKESETEFAIETCNSINQFLKDKKSEVISDIMEDVMDDHVSNSFSSVEIY